ncbi:MAG: 6-pyruvoyl tetrahydropterin synthase family protein [Candidatus Dormibacteria bacterium]
MARPSRSGAPALVAAQLDLARGDIGFVAAHFSVVAGRAERLHGHNYRVSLRATGAVSAEGTVVDFGSLKRALRLECAALDERMLLPDSSDTVQVTVDGDDVHVAEGTRRFVFPTTDVALLPIPNTTCEWLAAHLIARLRGHLGDRDVRLALTVEEVPGQSATVQE